MPPNKRQKIGRKTRYQKVSAEVKDEDELGDPPALPQKRNHKDILETIETDKDRTLFAWNKCTDKGDAERVKIKDDAVNTAEKYAAEICRALTTRFRKISYDNNSLESKILGARRANIWAAEIGKPRPLRS
jgi:hypothetical protein